MFSRNQKFHEGTDWFKYVDVAVSSQSEVVFPRKRSVREMLKVKGLNYKKLNNLAKCFTSRMPTRSLGLIYIKDLKAKVK